MPWVSACSTWVQDVGRVVVGTRTPGLHACNIPVIILRAHATSVAWKPPTSSWSPNDLKKQLPSAVISFTRRPNAASSAPRSPSSRLLPLFFQPLCLPRLMACVSQYVCQVLPTCVQLHT